MRALGFPDQHYLNSAIGWLELGNPREAKVEAERISSLGRVQEQAFLVRWKIAARCELWEEARRLGAAFTQASPDRPTGWICLSYSLYRLRRPLEAWMQLLPRTRDLPFASAIPYVLACYAWEMGNRKLADAFLARSAALGGPRMIKSPTLQEPDISHLASPIPPPTPPPQADFDRPASPWDARAG
jgi:hypothetical protein